MNKHTTLGLQLSRRNAARTASPGEDRDPDRLPELRPDAKRLSLREAVEIAKASAKDRRSGATPRSKAR